MSPFVRYTLARLGLFVVAYVVVWLVAARIYGTGSLTVLWVALVALAISAVASFLLLRALRDELATSVQERAERMSQRIEESRRAEDLD